MRALGLCATSLWNEERAAMAGISNGWMNDAHLHHKCTTDMKIKAYSHDEGNIRNIIVHPFAAERVFTP